MEARENRTPPALLRGLAALLFQGPQARFIRRDLDDLMARDIDRGMTRARAPRRYTHNLLASAASVRRAR